MKTRFAFVGFRHNHVFDLLAGVEARTDCEVVACCEEDSATRSTLAEQGRVKFSHADFATMLREVPCEVVAIGDYYARRGALAIAALRAGRHVLSDKPLCTTIEEQAEIEQLAAKQKRLVGLQLDCRDSAAFRTLREIVRSGEVGEVVTVRVEGQHPLLLGTRPGWYFEPGKHGGTINDIGLHAFDFLPWLTGHDWKEVLSARTWNAKASAFPHFHDGAQVLATLANGAGVFADFSYLAPDRLGYALPHYWQVVIHGTSGRVETHLLATEVAVITDTAAAVERRPVGANRVRGYLEDFLRELRGELTTLELTSADCLRASRMALQVEAQAAG